VRALFDVNVLLALFDSDHLQHSAAIRWHDTHRQEGWASCAITQNGFVRIMSRAGRFPRVNVVDAIAGLRAQISTPDHEFWPGNISIADATIFRNDRILGPNQITDAYLLALALKNEGRLVTFDRRILLAAVHGAEQRHLVVL
jgi:toxin-antitoxin system PIN domain toxin